MDETTRQGVDEILNEVVQKQLVMVLQVFLFRQLILSKWDEKVPVLSVRDIIK